MLILSLFSIKTEDRKGMNEYGFVDMKMVTEVHILAMP